MADTQAAHAQGRFAEAAARAEEALAIARGILSSTMHRASKGDLLSRNFSRPPSDDDAVYGIADAAPMLIVAAAGNAALALDALGDGDRAVDMLTLAAGTLLARFEPAALRHSVRSHSISPLNMTMLWLARRRLWRRNGSVERFVEKIQQSVPGPPHTQLCDKVCIGLRQRERRERCQGGRR